MTIEKEALALIQAAQHFDVYVGEAYILFTDHLPLTFIQSLQNYNQRLMALFLQAYRLVIRHSRGRENVMAEALSGGPEELE